MYLFKSFLNYFISIFFNFFFFNFLQLFLRLRTPRFWNSHAFGLSYFTGKVYCKNCEFQITVHPVLASHGRVQHGRRVTRMYAQEHIILFKSDGIT
mgnify:CR=1 FL=1